MLLFKEAHFCTFKRAVNATQLNKFKKVKNQTCR